jgi:hypothetical protein
MAHVFKHPGTDRRETVGIRCSLCVLVAGVAYLAYRGQWVHALMAGIILALPVYLCCTCLLSFTLPLVSVAYSLAIQDILAADYLDRGWVEIGPSGA